ncbi:hypothetical protein A4H97_14955 [Niastella yeongjuensis]|uniref:IPT/TIG domain-containing protein n=1 Tax=Niastella yeongjuensis TaxID=354355 RepID=A0A1V9E477_9BACT|nr:hypothetical protein A4H97_14955 [Niastella yeongjuensis]
MIFIQQLQAQSAITPWSFDASYMPSAGVLPNDVASTDVDGDGKVDMIVLSAGYPYTVSVYRNISSGPAITFAPKVDFFASDPTSMATGDFDGDGKTDIAVTNYTSLTVSIFRNLSTPGNINFSKTDLSTFLSNLVVIGDLNNDGKPDLVTANWAANSISIFKNTGSPGTISFAAKIDYPAGGFPASLSIGDLDGDHWNDLVIGAGSVSIYKNNGVAGSPSFSLTGVGSSIASGGIKLADLDGDSKPDLMAGSIAVYRNTGSPGTIAFAAGTTFPATSYGNNLCIGDIDHDGKVDLVFSDGSSIGIYRNSGVSGSINFDAEVNVSTKTSAGRITIADFNNDQKPDLASVDQGDNSATIYRNRFDEPTILSFTPTESPAGGNITITGLNFTGATAVSFGNVAAQSFNVVSPTTIQAVVGTGASGEVSVTGATGTGIATGFKFWDAPQITSFTPAGVYAGEEVTITGRYFTGATAVLFGGTPPLSYSVVSDNVITATVGFNTSGTISITTPGGTVNQPGYTYLTSPANAPVITSFTPVTGPIGTTVTITGNYFGATPATNIVYFGATKATVLTASATSLTVQVPVGASYQPITVATGRLTAQTQIPFVVTYPSAGPAFTVGSFSTPGVVDAGGVSWELLSPDFNGDGKPDLVHANPYPNNITVEKNTSTGNTISFNDVKGLPGLIGVSYLETADMNGDGKTDIIAAHAVNQNDAAAISIKRNISTVSDIAFAPEVNVLTDGSSTLAVTDLDLDGRPDVIVTSIAKNHLYVFKNTSIGSLISLAAAADYATGDDPMHLSTGDIDGDGRPEILVTNRNANTVSIYPNISTPGTINFAAPIDMSVDQIPSGTAVADYDGDGKLDIAVMTQIAPAAVSIYRNTSTAGAISLAPKFKIELPSSATKLKSGDLDGDGKPDMVLNTNGILVYIKNRSTPGNLAFAPVVSYQHNQFPIDIAIADFDGDSKSDIITSFNGMVALRNQVGSARVLSNVLNGVTALTTNRSVVDASVQTYNGSPYVQRHYDVVPTNNAATLEATVTLYFTQQEFDNYNAAPGHGPDLPKQPTDVTNKANLRIYQFHGESVTGIPGSYSGLGVEINPDDANIVWNNGADCWEVTFDVKGFSGFFAASVGFVKGLIPPAITSNGPVTFCQGGNVLLTSSSTVNNQWYKNGVAINGATGVTYNANAGGDYTATNVVSGFLTPPSNRISVTVNPIPEKPFISMTGSSLISSVIINSVSQWYLEGVLIPGATNNGYTPTKSGYYSVEATVNGCTGPRSDKLFFVVTGVVNIDNTQFIRLSPNPVESQLQLTFNLNITQTVNVQLIDLKGRVIGAYNQLSNTTQVNLSGIAAGVYLAKIFNPISRKSYVIKVLKQ